MNAFQPGAEQEIGRATLDIALPIYNECGDLEVSVRRLRSHLDHRFPFRAGITIVDNASTDGSWEIATRLAATVPGVRALHLDLKGRGRALRAAWTGSDADVVAYMDVDLSTGLDALLPLVAPLISGHGDVAIGTRLAQGARVFRGPKREVISRLYNLILRVVLRCRFSDAQCGFKAMRTADARVVLPLVVDNEWFFDTELLVVAERAGLRICEVPVDWSDDPNSSVHVATTARKDLQGVWRMLRTSRRDVDQARALRVPHLPAALDELLHGARLGVVGLVIYGAVLAISVRFVTVSVANLVALALGAVVSTSLASRATPAGTQAGLWPRTAAAGLLLATSAVATTAVIGLAMLLGAGPLVAGLAAATLGMSAAAATRFILCRALVFRAYLVSPLPGDHLPSDANAGPGANGQTDPSEGWPPIPVASDTDVMDPVDRGADTLAHH